ncbi:Putative glutathione S-transferase, Thioredoxin-like superfamily, glutathione Transferase family [Septoria linicola]|uniref:Glutathione S-transferase, Thioredoxin-like superfamily, glutathione Transferase family n=1 Tax=Septoria linicola TaxID=215465 RepID=A0A9Q9EGA7_9PEZI|nr:putative glutathione S-transferase, Thioredoxin-like superfamily, glutathione Transferase family [Septoria linicola]USW48093.1 Putative glutathione S-transferase, Thioredoxin-like superfamily, glutathione Transferase family [Septoria linicola]
MSTNDSSNSSSKQELDPNQGGDAQKKTYHKQPTGKALETANAHATENDLKLYGSCFCPFVHRVWISLEFKGLDYEYVEVDVYRKPKLLLDINPRGLVPALRHGNWGSYESTVLMEYLEDLNQGPHLLPPDPKLRAHSRLWSDHINRHIIPAFYKYLQAQEAEDQVKFARELKEQISKVVDAADHDGPFFLGSEMSFVDVQIAPWVVRMDKVLKPYRGWPSPEPGSRFERWVRAIEDSEPVKNTTSTDDLYLDSYERYAENRPNTSQVREAINSGGGLP